MMLALLAAVNVLQLVLTPILLRDSAASSEHLDTLGGSGQADDVQLIARNRMRYASGLGSIGSKDPEEKAKRNWTSPRPSGLTLAAWLRQDLSRRVCTGTSRSKRPQVCIQRDKLVIKPDIQARQSARSSTSFPLTRRSTKDTYTDTLDDP
jgi:hypothetical protein